MQGTQMSELQLYEGSSEADPQGPVQWRLWLIGEQSMQRSMEGGEDTKASSQRLGRSVQMALRKGPREGISDHTEWLCVQTSVFGWPSFSVVIRKHWKSVFKLFSTFFHLFIFHLFLNHTWVAPGPCVGVTPGGVTGPWGAKNQAQVLPLQGQSSTMEPHPQPLNCFKL